MIILINTVYKYYFDNETLEVEVAILIIKPELI